jgi:hypothetical protein
VSIQPRYPVYVISKGRATERLSLTAKALVRDGVRFSLVVEPQEADAYAALFGRERLLVLPFSNLGLGSIPARNWVWEHSKGIGAEKHWILDDNIRMFYRRWKSHRIGCEAGPALAAVEDFADRYENIAIAGMNYSMFVPDCEKVAPFFLNVHVYSCLLILNSLPNRWRGRYNEDTDLCLQVLADGWCTVLINAFLICKMQTMTMAGGNTSELYKGDGRLRMARSLERMWPGVVKTTRRWNRPQHVVAYAWEHFDTPLKRKAEVDFTTMKPNEYGLVMKQVAAEIKNPNVRKIYEAAKQQQKGKA